jgi:hypothetical protein
MTPPTKLRALGGRDTPAQLLEDAKSVGKLTPGAVAHIWTVLEPCLTQPMSPALASEISAFCLRHEVAEADLGRAIRAARTLLREAAAIDLSLAALTEDAAILFAEGEALCAQLVGRYEAAKANLRQVLFLNTLSAHGAVLDDVDWRLDYVAATTDAPRLLMPVALLTLSYRDHGDARRLTLQVTADQLGKLESICRALLDAR